MTNLYWFPYVWKQRPKERRPEHRSRHNRTRPTAHALRRPREAKGTRTSERYLGSARIDLAPSTPLKTNGAHPPRAFRPANLLRVFRRVSFAVGRNERWARARTDARAEPARSFRSIGFHPCVHAVHARSARGLRTDRPHARALSGDMFLGFLFPLLPTWNGNSSEPRKRPRHPPRP